MAPVFKCLEAVFELLVPMAVAKMIDLGIGRGDTSYILKMGAVLLILAFIGIVCSLTAQWFAASSASIAATGLRNDLLKHILSLDYSEIDKYGTDRFLTSMTLDVNQVQNGINMFLRLFMRSPFVVFGAAIMAFQIDKKMSLIFFVTILILTIIVFGILLGTVPLYKKVQLWQDRIIGLSKEQITGSRVIRAFNREKKCCEEFAEDNRRLTAMQIFVSKISAVMNPVTALVLNAAIIVLIWRGAIFIDFGTLSKGNLVALINYMGQILVELVKFANLIILISKAVASDRRIEEIFSYTNNTDESHLNSSKENVKKIKENSLIKLENVDFYYPEAKEPALSNINLEINKEEHIGIIGGTGSGKSTLAKLIAGLYMPSSGYISYNDNLKENYEKPVTMVPQKAVMFEGSVRENIVMGKAVSEELIEFSLKVSQSKEFVESFDDSLMHHIEQGGRNLSGGQKQRLGIARGLCMNSPVLVLDDPASALDFATERKLREELTSFAEEKELTLIVISQRAAMVKNMDKIIVMNDGMIEAIGSHDKLIHENELYREIFLSQQKEMEVAP
ncbi:MAG: ABC transporter ATP-binding protein [Eubacteriales bacterium]|nr:ABC transporter ATP-binding protein [Eubacteriales bacterium]